MRLLGLLGRVSLALALTAALLALFILFPVRAHAITRGSVPDPESTLLDAIGAYAVTWRLGLEPEHPEAAAHAWSCSAVLITPTRVALAKHCVTDGYGFTAPAAIRFRRALDGSLGSLEQGPDSFFYALVASYFDPDAGDLIYANLSQPVKHIAPIPRTPRLTLSYPGEPGIVAGWGKTGPGLGEGAAEQLLLCETPVHGSTGFVSYHTAYYNPFPCGPNQWDSGGAILINTTNGWRVAGVVNNQSWGAALPVLTPGLRKGK